MASNEHGSIEQNVENHETNNSIYYTRETELYAESYAMLNRGTCCKMMKTWRIFENGKSQPATVDFQIRSRERALGLTGVGREEGGWREAAGGRAPEEEAGGAPERWSVAGRRRTVAARGSAAAEGGGGGDGQRASRGGGRADGDRWRDLVGRAAAATSSSLSGRVRRRTGISLGFRLRFVFGRGCSYIARGS